MKKTTYNYEEEKQKRDHYRAISEKIRKEQPEIYAGVARNRRRAEIIRRGGTPKGQPYIHPSTRDLIRSVMSAFHPDHSSQ